MTLVTSWKLVWQKRSLYLWKCLHYLEWQPSFVLSNLVHARFGEAYLCIHQCSNSEQLCNSCRQPIVICGECMDGFGTCSCLERRQGGSRPYSRFHRKLKRKGAWDPATFDSTLFTFFAISAISATPQISVKSWVAAGGSWRIDRFHQSITCGLAVCWQIMDSESTEITKPLWGSKMDFDELGNGAFCMPENVRSCPLCEGF